MLAAINGDIDEHQSVITHMLKGFAEFTFQLIRTVNLQPDMAICFRPAHTRAILTPSAAGRPKPIVPSPPELIQRRGLSNG